MNQVCSIRIIFSFLFIEKYIYFYCLFLFNRYKSKIRLNKFTE